eukprot:CAMPEP_0194027208 /NCGR_PEP_ID=MMETSP0009_2-20130614/1388_1 /TAXON_ID=210454 /ORGANISM="Grammatophora oceanica, Strain CCMP 410" /LENGTH=437 /DNA_ID=CAMNT_0038666179 /DNA_START=453 /DNA_END=1766 /DNA_ORIENTATION=+
MPRPPPPPGPPAKGRPPPPPPPGAAKRPPPPPPARAGRPPPPPASRPAAKRRSDGSNRGQNGPPPPLRKPRIMAPAQLRDVNSFQKKHQVGQGTYGSVFVGADKVTNEIVALKRINTEQEENGFPITAIREVKILKALKHVNIVNLKEIVTSKEQGGDIPKNVFMVFEYLEYDLTGILETPEIRLSQDHVKSWSQQLLRGCHYMHRNKVIHRDLKASNLLVNRRGELKIADWGLARSWNSDMKRLTNRVITLWYRPPELLLGAHEYNTKIDMWSVGCIIAEMFRRSGFLRGSNEATQLDLIFRTCGHPTKELWPDVHKKCKLWKNFRPKEGEEPRPRVIRQALKTNLPHPRWMTEHAIDLIDNMMILNPDNRWSAEQALLADYFFDDPPVKDASKLSMRFSVDSVHEWECRRRHEKMMAARSKQANGGGPKPPPPRK